MKRKFAFLAPLRIPSRAENRALKAHLENQTRTHDNDHDVVSPLSPLLSAFIDRRELDDETETQLKAACAAIVKGYVDEPETKLNFKPLSHTKSVPHLNGGSSNNDRRSSSRPQTSSHASSGIPPVPYLAQYNSGGLNSRSVQDFRHMNLNHTPRQTTSYSRPMVHDPDARYHPAHADPRKNTLISPTYRPKTAPIDESDGSYETPRTASTDRYLDSASTAFTSTAITPSMPLQRVSGQVLKVTEDDVDVPIKHVLEQLDYAAVENRIESRDWSSQPKPNDAIRPNTAVESRLARRDSLQYQSVHAQSFGRTSSASYGHIASHVYDSFDQDHLGSKSELDLTKSNLEGTHFELTRHSTQVNLNRALPPLPKLDTWRRHNNAPTVQSEPTPTTASSEPKLHVVDLMKPGFPVSPLESSSFDFGDINSRPEPPPKDEPVSALSSSNTSRHRSFSHSKSSSIASISCLSPTIRSRAPSGSISRSTIPEDGVLSSVGISPLTASPHPSSHHTRLSSATTAASASLASTRTNGTDSAIPNFSRKISIDIHGGIRSRSQFHADGVTALPPMPPQPKQRAAGLRRVFSSLNLGGGNRQQPRTNGMTWMDHFEAEGIKSGMLVARGNGPAAAPIVRY